MGNRRLLLTATHYLCLYRDSLDREKIKLKTKMKTVFCPEVLKSIGGGVSLKAPYFLFIENERDPF